MVPGIFRRFRVGRKRDRGAKPTTSRCVLSFPEGGVSRVTLTRAVVEA
jgi:hypothetical protein